MIPLFLGAIFGLLGYAIGRNTKPRDVVGALAPPAGFIWNPGDPAKGIPGHWQRERSAQPTQSPIEILMQLVARRMPVSPGLAQAAFHEAMRLGDTVTAQQIALVFFPPQQPPPPIVVGEEENAALQETYGDASPIEATSGTIHHTSPVVQDISPEEWREFLLCFRTKDPSYRGERHIGAFEHSTRRLSQLGIDPNSLTTEESQLQALDKDLNSYLQSCEKLLNDFTGETISVNGEKVGVTRSGILALLKAAGPAGAKGWLTEEHQRKAFPHTTEIFKRGNGRF